MVVTDGRTDTMSTYVNTPLNCSSTNEYEHRYNLDYTRIVVHTHVSFKWYNFVEIIPVFIRVVDLVKLINFIV